jgi:hypothetical protein
MTFITSVQADITADNIVTAGLVDGVDVSDFKTDYDSKVDQAVTTTSDPTFNNLTVSGNLTVNGSTTQVDSTTVTVTDPLMKLAKDNVADSVDIGLYGTFNDGSTKYAGIVRDASDGKFKVFESTTEPSTTADVTTLADISCANIDVTGLVDGRDVAADGSAQDTHIADATLHRVINDAGISATELWSADKINTEVVAIDGRLDALEAQSIDTYTLTDVAAATYTALESDYIITVSYTATGSCTVTLPEVSTLTTVGNKKLFIIKDSGGNANTNNITIAASGSDTIDGNSSFVLFGDYNAVQVMSDGSNWFVI